MRDLIVQTPHLLSSECELMHLHALLSKPTVYRSVYTLGLLIELWLHIQILQKDFDQFSESHPLP